MKIPHYKEPMPDDEIKAKIRNTRYRTNEDTGTVFCELEIVNGAVVYGQAVDEEFLKCHKRSKFHKTDTEQRAFIEAFNKLKSMELYVLRVKTYEAELEYVRSLKE